MGNKKHGMAGTPTYSSWKSMKDRCSCPNHKNFDYYSRLGVCDEWMFSFCNFLKDMGARPTGTTLDRIDNNKGYSKENCRWASKKVQNINRRSYSNTGEKNITEMITYAKGRPYKYYLLEIKRDKKTLARRYFKEMDDAIICREKILEEEEYFKSKGEE